MPKRNDKPDRPYDACRIYGTLILNKVAGNFHITAGKSLALPRGHIHISAFMTERDYNFTHRINRLNFGDPSPGVIHPLDGDEKISNDSKYIYFTFIMLNRILRHVLPVKNNFKKEYLYFRYDAFPIFYRSRSD